MTDAPSPRRNLLVGATALLLVLALAAVAWVQTRQHRLLGESVRFQDEYLQISLNQLQAEYLRLRLAIDAARSGATTSSSAGSTCSTPGAARDWWQA